MPLRPAPEARTAKAAEQRLKEVLQHGLSCISRAVWVTTPSLCGPLGTMLLTTNETPVPLRTRGYGDLYLAANIDFRFVYGDEDWRCTTLAYTYTLHSGKLAELMSWQWRVGSSRPPHLHVRAEREELSGDIHKLHLPTGRIAFEEIAGFLIEDLGVTPRMPDWRERIDEAYRCFRTHRTWPGSVAPPSS